MSDLIECVPNFSTSKPEIIEALVEVIETIPTALVLNTDADNDYNRVVITYVVDQTNCVEAAYQVISKALSLINMEHHRGQHPRIGAVDVFPLIPLTGSSFEDCIILANKIAKQVGTNLKVPVFLYAKAAKTKQREKLSNIRKGEYEGLKSKLSKKIWKPDYGPARFVPKSGAVVVGVRNFLIAYNINLSTSDVKIAIEISRSIRTSGWYEEINGEKVRTPGKLKGIQAMGVKLERKNRKFVQVSTNVLDFQNKTPIHQVFEEVKLEAKNYDSSVTGSEIVGMVPLDAILQVGNYYSKSTNSEEKLVQIAIKKLGLNDLETFHPEEKIIEYKLQTL